MTKAIAKPRLHPQYRAFELDAEYTAFLGPLGPTVLAGPYPRLAPWLDGTRTVEDLARQLAPGLAFTDVFMALHQLQLEGLVDDAEARADAAVALPPAAADAEIHLRFAGVASSGVALVTRLARENVVSDANAPRALLICEDELDPAVAAFAATAAMPWMLVTLAPPHAVLGPCFTPGAAPCWASFAARRREIRAFEQYVHAHARECSPAGRGNTADVVLDHMGRAFRGYALAAAARPEELWVLDLARGDWSLHRVGAHEACPHCVPAMATAALPGFSAPIAGAAVSATEHISGYTGIIARISDYDPETAPGAICAFAEHLFPPDAGRADAAWRGFRRRSSGKGRDAAEARTSALMEAIERYCGAARGHEAVIRASLAELGGPAVAPQTCLGFSETQYRDRGRTNPTAAAQSWVPAPYDPRQPADWIPAWSLTARQERFVPAAFCFYGYPPPDSAAPYAIADSNGCAAGTSVADAILRGCLELVERDAVGLWWYNYARRPAPALEDASADEITRALAHYHRAGRAVSLLDLTTDLGIPVAAAISWDCGTGGGITVGFGADFDARRALHHAVEEMNQFLPEALERGPGRVVGANPLRDSYLHPWPQAVPATAAVGVGSDTRERMTHFVALAAARGLEVLVVNQTRSDVRIPVVKVIVPGLCHFWPRFGVARLYAAPVSLGWIAAPLREADLNSARFLL